MLMVVTSGWWDLGRVMYFFLHLIMQFSALSELFRMNKYHCYQTKRVLGPNFHCDTDDRVGGRFLHSNNSQDTSEVAYKSTKL